MTGEETEEASGRKLDIDRYAFSRRIALRLCLFLAQPTGTESGEINY